jgi:hypothetical protein
MSVWPRRHYRPGHVAQASAFRHYNNHSLNTYDPNGRVDEEYFEFGLFKSRASKCPLNAPAARRLASYTRRQICRQQAALRRPADKTPGPKRLYSGTHPKQARIVQWYSNVHTATQTHRQPGTAGILASAAFERTWDSIRRRRRLDGRRHPDRLPIPFTQAGPRGKGPEVKNLQRGA